MALPVEKIEPETHAAGPAEPSVVRLGRDRRDPRNEPLRQAVERHRREFRIIEWCVALAAIALAVWLGMDQLGRP